MDAVKLVLGLMIVKRNVCILRGAGVDLQTNQKSHFHALSLQPFWQHARMAHPGADLGL